jgi:large subunit ribosomal protein L25
MGEEIEAEIRLEFVGVAPGVKAHGGVLYKQMESLHVSCLPKDLVDHIEVDISVLEEIDDTIHVKDLEVPDSLTIQDDEDNLVAKVSEVSVEEFDEEEEEEEMGIEDIEVEGEKEELEEGEEAELEEGEEAPEEEIEE